MKQKAIIFGAGLYGENAYNSLSFDFDIMGFYDNNSDKHYTYYCGVEVLPPPCIGNIPEDLCLIIAALDSYPILEQLTAAGADDENIWMYYPYNHIQLCSVATVRLSVDGIVEGIGKQVKHSEGDYGLANNQRCKKICILAYEPFLHIVVTNAIIQISNYNANYVEVFTLQSTKDELASYLHEDCNKIAWNIIPEKDEYGIDYSKAYRTMLCTATSERIRLLNRWDIIIISSPEYFYETYSPILLNIPENTEVIAMIHNINKVFCGSDLRLRKLLGMATSYAVIDELLIDEIKSRNLTDKKIYEFPITFREETVTAKKESITDFSFVIPGGVDCKRDYNLVLDVLNQLQGYYDKIQVVFLGTTKLPYAKENEIILKCDELKKIGLKIKYFHDFVPTDQFQHYMRQADFILAPVNVHFVCPSLKADEVYGETKLTGSVLDMIEYARPGIVPKNLKMPKRLESSTVFYDNTPESLKYVIISLLDREVADRLAKNALENSRKYALELYLL